jgi:hypothetical protein
MKTLVHFTSLHFTSLHFTSLHFHFTSHLCTWLQLLSTSTSTSLHFNFHFYFYFLHFAMKRCVSWEVTLSYPETEASAFSETFITTSLTAGHRLSRTVVPNLWYSYPRGYAKIIFVVRKTPKRGVRIKTQKQTYEDLCESCH